MFFYPGYSLLVFVDQFCSASQQVFLNFALYSNAAFIASLNEGVNIIEIKN